LREIGNDVVNMLNPHRNPHDIRPCPGGQQFRFVQLAMRGRCGVDDEGPRVADIGEVTEQLYRRYEFHSRLKSALHAKGEHRAAVAAQILLGKAMIGIIGKARIANPGDLGMRL
jgi:hypothetical protein